jgi:imidazolonepropionase-like amidohydrolase
MRFRLVLFIACASISVLAQTSPPQLIRDVRVFDGTRVLEHRSVLIENGKIRQIYNGTANVPNAQIVDGAGRTLLPGLIDAHVHLPDDAKTAAQQALKFGVTTQLDMFSAGDRLKGIKKLEAEDAPDYSAVFTAGTGVTVAGGHPTQMGGPPIPTISGAVEAQAFVDARIAEGADYIKIIHDDGSTWPWEHKPVNMLDNATMQAVVIAAHKRQKIAVVHALSESQARDAVLAGADGLAHLFIGKTSSAHFGEFVASHHAFVIPTLSTVYLNCGRSAGPSLAGDPHLAPLLSKDVTDRLTMAKTDPAANHLCNGTDDAMRQLVRAKAVVLAGTDSPAPGTAYGVALHGELELLVKDGMSPVQALASATSVPAKVFHLNDRGVIKPGTRADLLLVEGDPTKNILDTRKIVAVWKRGVQLGK